MLTMLVGIVLTMQAIEGNWGFELGSLIGWTKTDTAFDSQPTYGDNPSARFAGQRTGYTGEYWIGTYERHPNNAAKLGDVQGDEPQGTLTSDPFVVRTKYIRFLIGGGNDVNTTRVELILNELTKQSGSVRRSSGSDSEILEPVEWNVSDLVGKTAQIRIVDESSGAWGHINCDDFQFTDQSFAGGKETPLTQGKQLPAEFFKAFKDVGVLNEQVKEFEKVKLPLAFIMDKGTQLPMALFADGTSVNLLSLSDARMYADAASKIAFGAEQVKLREELPQLLKTVRPLTFDNIAQQTAIRSQGGRGTCCVFGVVGAMEAAYKRAGHGDLDLSEQYANWLKNVTKLPGDPDHTTYSLGHSASWETVPASFSAGVGPVGVLSVLANYRTCAETTVPYIETAAYEDVSRWPSYATYGLQTFMWSNFTLPQHPVNLWSFDREQSPPSAREQLQWGIRGFTTLTPEEYQDPNMLEALVVAGRDIVFGMDLYGATPESNPRDPVWRKMPRAASGGSHCMSIVGYDRTRRFFIVKNSWGAGVRNASQFESRWSDLTHSRYNGYDFIDYDYLTTCTTEAGFVNSIEAPSAQLPQRLIGMWDVTISQISNGSTVSSGTLTWRRIPARYVVLQPLRIGDYHDSTHGDFRVNGEVPVMPPSRENVTFYINFDRPALNWTERSGAVIVCELQNITSLSVATPFLRGRFRAPVVGGGNTSAFGVPISDLEFTARMRT